MLFPLGKCVGKEQTLDKLYVSHLVYKNEVWGGTSFGPWAKPSGPHAGDMNIRDEEWTVPSTEPESTLTLLMLL